ncbi:DNA-directed primase/polymerase protein-like [Plakobranchus ocellatus]|uniref:DNA-directed primase/polymerase protein n=1 Tax=Plakobranchus ocellatus TaxID=259542 RepID=A0AAV4BME5_9GAST|nr:DNA-directed primase/polymerase protein-like [Plakobranchus ocellatus]
MASQFTSSPALTVTKFYGSSSARKRKAGNVLRKEKDYGEVIGSHLRVPRPFLSRISGPYVCWETFYRQQEAFDFVDKTSEDLFVFAFESSTNALSSNQSGQRRYLVTNLQQFWHYYRYLLPNQRHHYEVIREGRSCKLFFDLEYMTEFNPNNDGNAMVDILIKYVCLWLKEIFGVDCRRSDVLDMDASTAQKFSRHLVFQLNGAVFENCVVTGYFVRHIITILVQYLRLKTRHLSSTHCTSQCPHQTRHMSSTHCTSQCPHQTRHVSSTHCTSQCSHQTRHVSSTHCTSQCPHQTRHVSSTHCTSQCPHQTRHVSSTHCTSQCPHQTRHLSSTHCTSQCPHQTRHVSSTHCTSQCSDESQISVQGKKCPLTKERECKEVSPGPDLWSNISERNSRETFLRFGQIQKGDSELKSPAPLRELPSDCHESKFPDKKLEGKERFLPSLAKLSLKKKENLPSRIEKLRANQKGIDNGVTIDDMVQSFQDSSDEDELSFLEDSWGKYFINQEFSVVAENTNGDLTDDSDEELSLFAELCEHESDVHAVKEEMYDFDVDDDDFDNDEYEKELINSLEKWEASIAEEEEECMDDSVIAMLYQGDCDDQEIAALLDQYEKRAAVALSADGDNSDSESSVHPCEDCDDAELLALAQAFEENICGHCGECTDALVTGDSRTLGSTARGQLYHSSAQEQCCMRRCSPLVDQVPANTRHEAGTASEGQFSDVDKLGQIDERLYVQIQVVDKQCLVSSKDASELGGEARSVSASPDKALNREQEGLEGEEHGRVVDDGMERICSQFSLEELRSLMVLNKDGGLTTFCDLGVYTKNRNFRLYLSNKLNKNNPLVLASQNQYHPDPSRQRLKPQTSLEEALFKDSLVSILSPLEKTNILRFGPSFSNLADSRALEISNVSNGKKISDDDTNRSGHSASPFPQVDKFIMSLVSSKEKQGKIRMWRHNPGQDSITYHITGYRWCSNIGREHRSNNIFYTVNLMDWTYTQGCYDVDCRHAQRLVVKIPESLR